MYNRATRLFLAVAYVCVLLCLAPLSAQGDPIVYAFTGTAPGLGHTDSFQYTSPQFITSPIDLLSTQLDSCGNCLGPPNFAVIFFPNSGGFDEIQFNDIIGVGNGFGFQIGAFASPGIYSTIAGPSSGTLTVQAIPEANGLSLLGILVGAAAIYRGRRKRLA